MKALNGDNGIRPASNGKHSMRNNPLSFGKWEENPRTVGFHRKQQEAPPRQGRPPPWQSESREVRSRSRGGPGDGGRQATAAEAVPGGAAAMNSTAMQEEERVEKIDNGEEGRQKEGGRGGGENGRKATTSGARRPATASRGEGFPAEGRRGRYRWLAVWKRSGGIQKATQEGERIYVPLETKSGSQ